LKCNFFFFFSFIQKHHQTKSSLRETGYTGRIILISKENYLPIDRVKLSKSLKIELNKVLLRPQSFFDNNQIELMLGKVLFFYFSTQTLKA